MTVWYSSFDNDIMSDRAHEEYFESLVDDWKTKENFNVFLEENYYLDEVFEFTDAERDDARNVLLIGCAKKQRMMMCTRPTRFGSQATKRKSNLPLYSNLKQVRRVESFSCNFSKYVVI